MYCEKGLGGTLRSRLCPKDTHSFLVLGAGREHGERKLCTPMRALPCHLAHSTLSPVCPHPCHFFHTLQPHRPRIQLSAPFGSSMVILSVLTQFLSFPDPDSASQPVWDLMDGPGSACTAGAPFLILGTHASVAHEPRISCLFMMFHLALLSQD